MAKKSRSHRARRSQARTTRPPQQRVTPAAAPAPREEGRPRPSAAVQRPAPRPAARREAEPVAPPVDFRQEYRYVLADLRRLGFLALTMFVTLVVLNVVL